MLFFSSNSLGADIPITLSGSQTNADVALYEGKRALENKQYERAIELLSIAQQRLPLLSDYALFWRAQAYLASGKYILAAEDIQLLLKATHKSPLIRPARQLELEIAEMGQSGARESLYRLYLKDYPSDTKVKLKFARYLKNAGDYDRAKRLFRDIFITVSAEADIAEKELGDDLTTEDWLIKARNLNSGWRFSEAEQAFRNVLRKSVTLRPAALDGLAYALFRQRRYAEAAELYAQTNNTYWYARSLLRTNDLAAFEATIPSLLKSREKRVGDLLLAYATKKRRAGDGETAIKIYQRVAAQYPSKQEEALWLTAWFHYRAKNYQKAAALFDQLIIRFGGTKYQYWKNRCSENQHLAMPAYLNNTSSNINDFYKHLDIIRQGKSFPRVSAGTAAERILYAERPKLLMSFGLTDEAAQELKYRAEHTSNPSELIAISEHLKQINEFKYSVKTALRIPYSPAIHDLYYPLAYWREINDAAKKTGVDANLLLAIMREESRYDANARSIAGAIGLLQIMPQTADRIARIKKIPYQGAESLYKPYNNITIGSYYLQSLISEFGALPYAIAAYNAGEETVRSWVQENRYATVDEFIEDIPYYETRDYVKKVLLSYFQYLKVQDVTAIENLQRQLGRL